MGAVATVTATSHTGRNHLQHQLLSTVASIMAIALQTLAHGQSNMALASTLQAAKLSTLTVTTQIFHPTPSLSLLINRMVVLVIGQLAWLKS